MSDDLTARIIGAAMEVHSILGPGLLESIYEEALCHEFQLRNIPYARQVAVDVRYKDRVIQGQRLEGTSKNSLISRHIVNVGRVCTL